MNETLEAMAQTLYRHWFVDFGPFQDQPFVDSELGPIPEGWDVSTVAEMRINLGQECHPWEFYNEKVRAPSIGVSSCRMAFSLAGMSCTCTNPKRVAERAILILISVRAPVRVALILRIAS